MKGVLHLLVRWACRTGTRDLCSPWLPLVSPGKNILCTGGAYYVPYSFLLISNQYGHGGGGRPRPGRYFHLGPRAGGLSSFMHGLLNPPQYGP
jgi:hypothetical protein